MKCRNELEGNNGHGIYNAGVAAAAARVSPNPFPFVCIYSHEIYLKFATLHLQRNSPGSTRRAVATPNKLFHCNNVIVTLRVCSQGAFVCTRRVQNVCWF